MAISGGIHVYGWLKPTLTVELVAGGSLLPNTKYYVMGFMAYAPQTYSANGGPLSDVYEITTTTTDLSIKITHKTYRSITNFADNGDSRTKITCARHCLTDSVVGAVADTIKIATGSYAGTHTVDEWVDYDTFIINTAYVDNVAVQCYTDSQYYNRPFYGGNSNQGMAYYIGVNHPLDSGGLFNFAYENWDRRPYQAPSPGWSNPTTYTSQPTYDIHQYCDQPVLSRYGVGVFSSLNDYGSITVNTDGTLTLEDIYDEVQLSGFIYNCGWSECGFALKNKFSFFGSLRGASGTSITASGCEIQMSGAFYSTLWDFNAIKFTDCVITSQGTNSIAKCFTADNSVVFDTNPYITYTGWIRGTDLTIYAAPRSSNSYSDEDSTYYDEIQAVTKNIGIIRSKIFRSTGSELLQQNSYNQNKYEDCIITPIYLVLNGVGNKPDIYMMENCVMNYSYTYQFNFRVYHYVQYSNNEFKFLNIDAPDDPNNRKVVTRNRHYFNLIMRFYRRAELYVKDAAGANIVGAAINIVDDALNEYDTTTNGSGYGYLDVLEQKDVVVDTQLYSDPAVITYYTDFVITISKPGYATQTIHLADLYTNEKQTVTLLASTAETALIGSTIHGSTIY
jgi:hypothetical protein